MLKFTPGGNVGNGEELLCSSCDGNYLHQTDVEVFNRIEDASEGQHVTVSSKGVTVDNSMLGNPSDRRQGLKISFECEFCDATTVLTVVQHKGNTWVDTHHVLPEEVPPAGLSL